MENEERVICLCRECKGEKYVSQRTARRHSSLKRKIDDDQGEVPNRPSLESNIFNGSNHTLKQAIAMVMKIYSDFPQVSQAAITSFLQVLKELLPAGNLVPESYRAAHTMIKSQLTPVQEFHVCPNDHVIFTGELSNVENCPTCGTSRYNSDGTPVKKFQYLPLIPRLQRWSLVPKLRDLLRTPIPDHAGAAMVTDITQSQIWDTLLPGDDSDGFQLGFALSIDGIGPYNAQHNTYSMTPVLLSILNLPAELRNKFGFLFLSTIIPGKAAPKDINPYLHPLVEELKVLDEGILIEDKETTTSANTLKGRLMVGIYDTPGRAKVTKAVGGNSKKNACWQCDQEGTYCPDTSKVIFLGNRRFLPDDSPYRKESGFGDAGEENRPPPKKKPMREVLQAAARIDNAVGSRKEIAALQKESGRKGKEKLAELPYYEDVAAPLEPMHTIQVVIKKVISLLTEHQSAKMIKAEGKRRKLSKEVPVVHLTKEERRVADTRILNIRTPKHLVFNPKPFFSSYVYMRSADYRKLATEGILKYALRGMLGERQRKTLFALCDSIRDLCSGKCDDETIDAMDTKLQEVLARVERDFPLGLQTICFHLMHHFPDALRQLGPTVGWWMYPYERMLGNISHGIRNRKTPEANAVENYRISEFVKICEMTGEMPQLTDSSAPQTQTEIFTTSSKEVVNTTTDSSVVCLVEVGRNNEHQTHFGRIEVVSGEEAYVAWYADIRQDIETDLRYAPLPQTNKRKSWVRLSAIPPPIITAVEEDKIWFLNPKC